MSHVFWIPKKLVSLKQIFSWQERTLKHSVQFPIPDFSQKLIRDNQPLRTHLDNKLTSLSNKMHFKRKKESSEEPSFLPVVNDLEKAAKRSQATFSD